MIYFLLVLFLDSGVKSFPIELQDHQHIPQIGYDKYPRKVHSHHLRVTEFLQNYQDDLALQFMHFLDINAKFITKFNSD